MITRRSTADVWSYPNLQGSVSATADTLGALVSGQHRYDPFGETRTTVVDNVAGATDYAWLGFQLRLLEHASGIEKFTHMGARSYAQSLGRFLSVDPVLGGNSSDYTYVNDPRNQTDITGKAWGWNQFIFCVNARHATACAAAMYFQQDAYKRGEAYYNRYARSRDRLGISNAVRHAWYFGAIAYFAGASQARAFGVAHEKDNPGGQDALDTWADLANNEVGIRHGTNAWLFTSIIDGVDRSLKRGDLRCVKSIWVFRYIGSCQI